MKPRASLPSKPDLLPPDVMALPDVLLGYQQKLILLSSTSKVVFCEKSRRIGMTWGIAADAVLTAAASKAAKGMDVFYIGFNLEMAREFIDTSGAWAKNFSKAATAVEETVFTEQDANGDTRDIKAFRITFDSGFEIVALSSRPRSLRGRQGYVIIDEAAFHDDLRGLMKAALALLMWGGKVLVISTHDGVDNDFNQYMLDIKAKRFNYAHLRVDLDDALRDGLYERICLVSGQPYTKEGEAKWREELVSLYGEDADEELFCVPRRSGGAFLTGALIESRMEDGIPVLRYRAPDGMAEQPAYQREKTIQDWCEEHLKPLLAALDPGQRHYFGEDFGRSGDLTILWPIAMQQDTKRKTPFTVELSNVPFAQQRQIVFYVLDRLPNFLCGAFDARGNGSQLAEETMQRYGAHRIIQAMISGAWYQEVMPQYKAALEDGMMQLPKDADILTDHRAAVMQNGVAQIPDKRTKSKDGKTQRHGDSLIAGAMGYWASIQEVAEYNYEAERKKADPSTAQRRRAEDADAIDDARDGQNNFRTRGTY